MPMYRKIIRVARMKIISFCAINQHSTGVTTMKRHVAFALMLTLAPNGAWADQATDATADQLFQAGKFAEAAAQYRQVAEQTPSDYHATLQIGRIALLGNQFADAERW